MQKLAKRNLVTFLGVLAPNGLCFLVRQTSFGCLGLFGGDVDALLGMFAAGNASGNAPIKKKCVIGGNGPRVQLS